MSSICKVLFSLSAYLNALAPSTSIIFANTFSIFKCLLLFNTLAIALEPDTPN